MHDLVPTVLGGDIPGAGAAWMAAMRRGDFERAWGISDDVLQARRGLSCGHLPWHLRWLWDGTPLARRRVLIRNYHGLGDTLQFARFAPPVARLARSVHIEAQAELLPLLRSLPGVAGTLPLGAEPPVYDVGIEAMELAHALRVTLATIPAAVPYLSVPGDAAAAARSRLSSPRGLRVGLVWAAGGWRPERSLPLAAMAPLGDIAGVELVCLQQGPALRELDVAAKPHFCAIQSAHASPVETAALLDHLDLVVTVDTMMAHLAGALGRPVWTLLHAEPDWRWMEGREDSPWYPTMRLFRQPRPGAWEPVVQAVAAALARLVRTRSSSAAARCRRRAICGRTETSMAQHKSAEAEVTTDHDTIRHWVEARGGRPAAVKSTHRKGEPGIIRIMFPDAPHAQDDNLEEISWQEWFGKFDEAKLAFLHEETTAGGQKSLFNKLIGRETAQARESGESHASRHGSRSGESR